MARWIDRLLIGAGFGPLVYLVWAGAADRLGANPIDAITDASGIWTLRFLVASLAVTPVRRLARWPRLAPWRRRLGLLAFFYGTLHALTYVWLDQFFDLSEIVRDIGKRPFITAGFTAFVAMLPLAATSTARAVRWLGGVAWRRLHRLAYLAGIAGVVHYWWLVKADIRRPLAYGAVLAVLLAARLWSMRRHDVGADAGRRRDASN